MSIFSNPVTVVTDRTFSFVNQVADKSSVIFTWAEDDVAVAENSAIIIKQSRLRKIIRFLLKRTSVVTLSPVPVSGSSTAKADWNLTYTGDVRITEAQAQVELDILLALAAQSGFVRNAMVGAG